jgi:hypothetical protein
MPEESLIDRLSDITPDDLQILKTVSHLGAATAEEVALNLDHPADDLTPQLDGLVQRRLLTTKKMLIDDEEFEVYQVTSSTTKSFQSSMP